MGICIKKLPVLEAFEKMILFQWQGRPVAPRNRYTTSNNTFRRCKHNMHHSSRINISSLLHHCRRVPITGCLLDWRKRSLFIIWANWVMLCQSIQLRYSVKPIILRSKQTSMCKRVGLPAQRNHPRNRINHQSRKSHRWKQIKGPRIRELSSGNSSRK